MCLDLFYRTLPMAGPSGGDPPFLSPSPQSRIADTAAGGESPGSGCTPVQKRRLHFHEFMLRVHQRLHDLQLGRPRVLGRSRLGLPVYRCVSEWIEVDGYACTNGPQSSALPHAKPSDPVPAQSLSFCSPCRYEDPLVDPLDQVVAEVAATTRVLCLDELHVTDVADAMILSR